MPNLLLDTVSISRPPAIVLSMDSVAITETAVALLMDSVAISAPVALLMDSVAVSAPPPFVALSMDNVAISGPPVASNALLMDNIAISGKAAVLPATAILMDIIGITLGIAPPTRPEEEEFEDVFPVAPDPPAFLVGQDKGG